MEKVGVMAIVEGLSQFSGDMKSIDKMIRGLLPGANLVQAAFSKLGSFFSGIFHSAVRIVEYALGNLLAGAIRNVISTIKELIGSVIEAGKTFQTLEIRLNRLNFNEISKTVDDYTTAMDMAKEVTKENLKWLQKLAVMSPYDADDVALVFTMARSYGFAGEQAQGLTEDVLNFAAGMGLTSDHMKRIIYNFGQMEAAQKVTGRELRDLANSFVPVNDILLVMQERTGLTGDAFDDFRNSAEGVDMFLEEFSKLVADNYSGAASDLARTFEFATQNTKDLLQSLIGLNVVKPILDTLGGGIADFIDALTGEGRFEVLQTLFGRIGESISRIIQNLLGMGPSTDDMVSMVLKGVLGLADWFEANEEKITGFFQGIVTTVKENVIPWIKDKLIPAIQGFLDLFVGGDTDFFTNLKDSFLKLAGPIQGIAEAVGWIITTISNKPDAVIGVVDGIASAFQTVSEAVQVAAPYIQNIITWLSENQETVAAFVKGFLILQVVWAVIITVLGVLIPIITTLGIIIGAVVFIVSSGILPFIALGVVIGLLAALIYKNWDKIKDWTKKTWGDVLKWTKTTWNKIWDWIVTTSTGIGEAIGTWLVTTLFNIITAWTELVDTTKTKWEEFKQAIKDALTNIWTDLTTWISNTLSSIGTWADEFALKGKNAALKFWQNLVSGLAGLEDAIAGIVAKLLAALGPILNLNVNVTTSTGGGGGGGGGGSCFTAGTHILQPDEKTIFIEDVEEGTPVMCWDGEDSLVETRVAKLLVHESEPRTVWNVRLTSGTVLDVTPNHMVRSEGRWIQIGYLKVGDSLTNWRLEEDVIVAIVPRTEDSPVYNFEIEDEQHNYIAEGIVVHNAGTKDAEIAGSVPSPFVNNNTVNTVNNFSVNFGSATNPEPVLADFATLQSLLG